MVKSGGEHEALWWSAEADGSLRCHLCPRDCHLREGQRGFCHLRRNQNGKLWLEGYGWPSAVALDPIEKKPLHHFLPGSAVLSLGNLGCNLGCAFCQNWEIARSALPVASDYLSPAAAVELTLAHGAPSIAYTYNEPTVWAEYAIDIAREARQAGLRNVLVSNGYISPCAFHDLYDLMDAANIDLKSADESFYGRLALGHLQPVLDTLERIHRETAVWLEITNLVIPGENDSAEQLHRLCGWIASHLGCEVPLHLSAFHPAHKMLETPRTSAEKLHEACRIARAEGLQFVYPGNLPGGSKTICPSCGALLIRREGFTPTAIHLRDGCCPSCHAAIPGVWR